MLPYMCVENSLMSAVNWSGLPDGLLLKKNFASTGCRELRDPPSPADVAHEKRQKSSSS